jgi:hypothetical protein
VIDLIRGLLDRPLDPRHARAIVVIASCLTLAFAALVGFGVISGSRPTTHQGAERSGALAAPTAPPIVAIGGSPGADGEGPDRPAARPEDHQDPQDRRGSSAYRRASRTLREHRALQHLPFHRRGLSITLTGADHARAIVRVVAATVPEAKRRWRGFLRRFGDDGRSYAPRFSARSAHRKKRSHS